MRKMNRASVLATLTTVLAIPFSMVGCDGTADLNDEELGDREAQAASKVTLTVDKKSYSDYEEIKATLKNNTKKSIFIALNETKRFFFSGQEETNIVDEFVLEVLPKQSITTKLPALNNGRGDAVTLGLNYGLGCGDPATPIGVGDCAAVDKFVYSAQFKVGDKNPLASVTVKTNKENYYVTEPIVATLTNNSKSTIYVDNCAASNLEQKIGNDWKEIREKVCTVEELRPGKSLIQTLSASDESFYRVAFTFGLGCSTDLPLGQESCSDVVTAYSSQILMAYVK
jgi:hypothetical protein